MNERERVGRFGDSDFPPDRQPFHKSTAGKSSEYLSAWRALHTATLQKEWDADW
jgi:hypothetical protein